MSFDKYDQRLVFEGNKNMRFMRNPFWAAIPAESPVNLTIPGTPPFRVYPILYDTKQRTLFEYLPQVPGNLSTNQFTWTPVLQTGARDPPVTDTDGTDFRPRFVAGDSVRWLFSEMQGNYTNPAVVNDAYASGNFTIMTEEEYGKQDSVYSESQPNGSVVKRASLKGLALAAILCVSVLAG